MLDVFTLATYSLCKTSGEVGATSFADVTLLHKFPSQEIIEPAIMKKELKKLQ